MTTTPYTIDASGRKLGRVAEEAARYLMGKNSVVFERRLAPDVSVKVINCSKLSISEKKRAVKKYPHFSGYQGGLRFEKLETVIARKGYKEALLHAVTGMLPRNKLRPLMLKRLHLSE